MKISLELPINALVIRQFGSGTINTQDFPTDWRKECNEGDWT